MARILASIFQLTRIFFVEAIATGLLCFPFMMNIPGQSDNLLLLGFAVGFGIFAGVFISGPVSGGHINPAVTIICVLTRRLHILLAPLYIVAQFVGAILSCLVARAVSRTDYSVNNTLGMTIPSKDITNGQAIGLELVLTFGLVLGILTIIDELRAKTPFGINAGGLSVALYVGLFHVFDIVLAVSGPYILLP